MTAVRVVAPYVTLTVKDANGGDVVQGFYAGGVFDAVDNDALKKHLRNGMVEKVDGDSAGAVRADTEGAKTPGSAPATPEQPAGNASREAWVAWARAQGADEDELKDPSDGGLSRDDLRERYGK